MCDRCVMPSPGLPAPSLRTAYCLPAGDALRWVSNCLIYIILWSIRRAVLGAKSNFLPALREARADRSFEPRPIAVNVVRGASEARAVAADSRAGQTRVVPAALLPVYSVTNDGHYRVRRVGAVLRATGRCRLRCGRHRVHARAHLLADPLP